MKPSFNTRIIQFLIFAIGVDVTLSGIAPTSISIAEVLLVAFNGLLIVFSLIESNKKIDVGYWDKYIFFIYSFAFFIMSVSIFISIVYSESEIGSVIRSVTPYIFFVPIIFVSSSWKFNHFESIRNMFILCGIIQAIVIFTNFSFSSLTSGDSALGSRVTWTEIRAILPQIIAGCIFSLNYIKEKNLYIKIFGLTVYIICFFAIIATQTRAMMLAVLIGSLMLAWLQKSIFFKPKIILIISLSLSALFFLPQTQYLIQATVQRTEQYGDNGRLDEWQPAFEQYLDSSPVQYFFGIGTGTPIRTGSLDGDQDRTYLHNVSLYFLVYFGIFGLLSMFLIFGGMLYFLNQARKNKHFSWDTSLVISTCVALFFYANTFAVHKIFSFNYLIVLMIVSTRYLVNESKIGFKSLHNPVRGYLKS
jgi:O-antigen ligase